MSVSLIVAASENGVIGRDGDMPWRLSADLKRFKNLTMGHHLVMGRRTFESIGRLLPGRTTIIVSRQPDYRVDGALSASSVESALVSAAHDDEPFIVGGGQVYTSALPFVAKIYLTRVHAEIDGDTRLPEIDWQQWRLVERTPHEADDKNNYDCTFEIHERIN